MYHNKEYYEEQYEEIARKDFEREMYKQLNKEEQDRINNELLDPLYTQEDKNEI